MNLAIKNYKELIDKYPAFNIKKTIDYWIDYYTKNGFKDKVKKVWLENIKDFLILEKIDFENKNDEKKEKYTKKENKKNVQYNKEELKEILNKLYYKILKVLREYIDLEEYQYKILALWIIGTYTHEDFKTYPLLYFNAMRGSGKTRALNLLSHLCYGANKQVNVGVTESVLFRTPEKQTMLFDEMENIRSKDKVVLREYLNACYKKGVSVSRVKKVKNINGENYEVEVFHPYKPIVMANIYGMEEVLEDRCITIIIDRSSNPEITKKIEDFDSNRDILWIVNTFSTIKDSLKDLVSNENNQLSYWNAYLHYYHNQEKVKKNIKGITNKTIDIFDKIIESDINGRDLELYFPLFMLSLLISEDIFYELLGIAKEKVKNKKEDELTASKDVLLIKYISQFDEDDFISIKRFTSRFRNWLNEDEDEDRWLNERYVGRALKRLKLIKTKRRVSIGMEVIFDKKKAKEKIKIFEPKEDTHTNERG